jgi:hypothetical protein
MKCFVSGSSLSVPSLVRLPVAVARMIAVGEELLMQRGFYGDSAKMGFHVRPFTSVPHLHLHCLSLPVNNRWRDIK